MWHPSSLQLRNKITLAKEMDSILLGFLALTIYSLAQVTFEW